MGAHSRGMAKTQLKRNQGAPVMTGDVDAVEPQRVQQCDDVGEQPPAVVAARRRIRHSSTAQVRADHSVGIRERRKNLPPFPPVLRKAVQEEDRLTRACLGKVHTQAGQLNEAMLNARQLLLHHAG